MTSCPLTPGKDQDPRGWILSAQSLALFQPPFIQENPLVLQTGRAPSSLSVQPEDNPAAASLGCVPTRWLAEETVSTPGQGSASLFCKKPESKHLGFCGLYISHCNGRAARTVCTPVSLVVFPETTIYGH